MLDQVGHVEGDARGRDDLPGQAEPRLEALGLLAQLEAQRFLREAHILAVEPSHHGMLAERTQHREVCLHGLTGGAPTAEAQRLEHRPVDVRAERRVKRPRGGDELALREAS